MGRVRFLEGEALIISGKIELFAYIPHNDRMNLYLYQLCFVLLLASVLQASCIINYMG